MWASRVTQQEVQDMEQSHRAVVFLALFLKVCFPTSPSLVVIKTVYLNIIIADISVVLSTLLSTCF